MGLADVGSNWGSAIGAQYGADMSKDDLVKIMQYLQDQYGDASKLDPSSLDKTAFDGISTDPRTRTAQMAALSQLSGLADQNGLDPQAKAMQAQANSEAAGFEASQRAAVQQSLQARGMGGSGAEVAGLNAAQQGGANRSAQGALQASADARNRAMGAAQAAGQLGGQIHHQDYGEAADRAHAHDTANHDAWMGKLQRLGVMGQSRQGLENYYAADRASTIGQWAAMGGAGGGLAGAAGDGIGGALTGGGAGGMGGGGAASAKQQPGFKWNTDDYGSWGNI